MVGRKVNVSFDVSYRVPMKGIHNSTIRITPFCMGAANTGKFFDWAELTLTGLRNLELISMELTDVKGYLVDEETLSKYKLYAGWIEE